MQPTSNAKLTLIPTKVKHIKSVRLDLTGVQKPKFIGHYDEKNKIFRTKRNDFQVHRLTHSLAFNYDLVHKLDIEIFQVEFRGNFLYIAKEYLLKIGTAMHFQKGGAELQMFAPIEQFSKSIKEAKDKLDNQFEMFSK